MKNETIEQYLKDIENPDKTGFPAIMAIKNLKKALKKGAVIPDEYDYVDDIFLRQKRADCLQAMGIDAWQKSHDENRDVQDRLELLKAIEGFKGKGDFGWQVFGITERDFYWQKMVLEVENFNGQFDNQADFYASKFNDKFDDHRLRYELESNNVLSDEDINAILDMCTESKGKKYAEMKAKNVQEFQILSAKADDERVPFEDRIQALQDAKNKIGYFWQTASDAEKEKSQDMHIKRDSLFSEHFRSRYNAAIGNDNALVSYDALVQLDEDARNEGYELADVLSIEWPAFYGQQEQFLYAASDELIQKTEKMADKGDCSEAYNEFQEYFLSRMKSLEDAGHNITKIRSHSIRLFKAKTKSEFDYAVALTDIHARADRLSAFGSGGIMSGNNLDDLFGEAKANEMRGVAKRAFVDCAKEALSKYEVSGDEHDLWRVNYWRADKSLEWSDITDNFESFQAKVESNGHRLQP